MRRARAKAIRESVCRLILFPDYGGVLTWLWEGREHWATFEDGLTFKLQRERLKTALLQDSWLGPVMTDVHAELRRLSKQEQPDAGGLTVAMNLHHPGQVAELVGRITSSLAYVAVSDDPPASKAIAAFAQHTT